MKIAKKIHGIAYGTSLVLAFLMLLSGVQNLFTLNNGGTWTGVLWSIIFLTIFASVILFIKKHYAINEFIKKEAEEME